MALFLLFKGLEKRFLTRLVKSPVVLESFCVHVCVCVDEHITILLSDVCRCEIVCVFVHKIILAQYHRS